MLVLVFIGSGIIVKGQSCVPPAPPLECDITLLCGSKECVTQWAKEVTGEAVPTFY